MRSTRLPGWAVKQACSFLTFFIFRTGFPHFALTVIISNLLGFILVMGEHFVISEAFCNAAVWENDST